MSIKINPVMPSAAMVGEIASSTQYIVRNRLVEIKPNSSTTFSRSGNSEIVFDIESPSDLWDYTNSYLRFDLTCSLKNNDVDVASKYLASGGGHSLFRRGTLESIGGKNIETIDRMNMHYYIHSAAQHDHDHVNFIGAAAGDSVEPDFDSSSGYSVLQMTGTVTYNAGDVTGVGTKFLTEFSVGDLVRIATSASKGAVSVEGTVLSITNDTTMDLQVVVGAANIAATALIYKVNAQPDAVRKVAANTADYTLCVRPMFSFLELPVYHPLFLMRGGLRIRLQLEEPYLVLACNEAATGTGFSGEDYIIKNPTFVCDFVTPSEVLSNQFLDAYNGEGLHYPYMMMHYDSDTSRGAGTENIRIKGNMQSARHLFVVIQDERGEVRTTQDNDPGINTFNTDSVAQGLAAGIEDFSVQSGSERFPLSRPIDYSGVSKAEAYQELERIFEHSGVTVAGKRFKPVEWSTRASQLRPFEQPPSVAESTRLILSAKLSRDPSVWAGLDTILHDLTVSVKFSEPYKTYLKDGTVSDSNAIRYIHSFLYGDAILKLDSTNGISTKY